MQINRKIEIAEQAIRSISQHDDADLAVREAALARLTAVIESECSNARERLQVKIDAAVGSGS